ncbi:hypothetical protein [Pleurocapsa sp. FMAR1]|uniref:hypothetical protein n=1 Tax=Pleurocapsa sp. FMAR1 TaxID=3040204 RepID=UPI0029C80686|nr:hypothetical protein [Pleurocapsa sp. FMAR1]
MVLCLNNEDPIIEWQYSGGAKQRILKADDYTLSTQFVYPRDTYYNLVYRSSNINNGVVTWNSDRTRYNSDRFNGILSWRLKVVYKGVISYPADNKFFTYVYKPSTDKYDTRPAGQRTADFYVEVVDSLGEIATIFIGSNDGHWSQRFIAADNQPIPTNCNFRILKNSNVVYQQIKDTCPEVTYSCGNQCPPGTCECSCGNTVCCYDEKTGEVVKSFKK